MTSWRRPERIPFPREQADASGEIAALYEDLRVTLGVPFANLIWRHLATDLPPHVLALVRQLDQFGRLGPSDAVASLYRHLAHWPAFLSIAYAALEPAHRSANSPGRRKT